ncbi:MAG: S41 family peptidase [Bdellovibrionales bacterium]
MKRTIMVLLFSSLLFLLGMLMGRPLLEVAVAKEAKDRYENLQVFAKVLNLVQQYYVEPVDLQKLIYGGIKGILNELDPHTNFLNPDVFAEFENETSGEFGGIGIEMSIQNSILTVLSPIEDSPAWKAGIKGGDKIVFINGESTKGFSLVDAAQRMRGKKDKAVKLGVFREGFTEPKEFTIVRDLIKIKSVKYADLEDGYAYVRITSFIEKTAKDFENILAEHVKKNKKIKGLVIDLRNNPGGLLDQAIKVSDMFLEEGVIVSTIGRNKDMKEVVSAKKEGTYEFFPLVVLINEYSASASEIVAGALQDNKRALIVGERSFGKGSVQSVVKLGDGSGLKLTVARYYTPSGVSIQAEGIKPNVTVPEVDSELFQKAVSSKPAKREQDMKGHLLGDKEKNKKKSETTTSFWFLKTEKDEKKLSDRDQLLKKDYQLLEAYNYVRSWDTFRKEKTL